jgi:hypothetical protein
MIANTIRANLLNPCYLRSINRFFFLSLIIIQTFGKSYSQSYLSNLNATKNDPIYTTYASAKERTNYKLDQAYSLSWVDPEKAIGFESKDGGSIFFAFKLNGEVRVQLKDYYNEPIITSSYSDIVKFFFYPFKNVRVEAAFLVYDSQFTILNLRVINQSNREINLEVYPFFEISSMLDLEYEQLKSYFIFKHNKTRDSWMKEHSIPYMEYLKSILMISDKPKSFGSYQSVSNKYLDTINVLQKSLSLSYLNNSFGENSAVISFQKEIHLQAGEQKDLRVVRGLDDVSISSDRLFIIGNRLMNIKLEEFILANEKMYAKIPTINFSDKEKEMLYWNAFTLIHQCMMQPEGETKFNYYIFSREPKWGWGYGGQVFHESLSMLAYAYMDPIGAMNSQRVYFQRQRKDGYINYRTGPYLNEEIIYNGEYTSSAPWFNYINYEIFKITGDKKFLQEAYNSGKRFYNWYAANRDSNNNGLASWGGHAELESVRDARVAVWDKVGWASNFEGPDVNSMLVMEEKSLSAMALRLGLIAESKEWEKKSQTRSVLINEFLWDEETEFYYNVNKSNQSFSFKTKNDLKIKEIIGFLPIWAGVAKKIHIDGLLKSLLNEKEFWRRFGIPTLSAKDDYYNPIGYWNGPIWIQWQYLIFRGLIDYGYKDLAIQLAEKVMDNVINQLKIDHSFWEFYSADDYQAGWNKTYIWSGLISRFLIDINSL